MVSCFSCLSWLPLDFRYDGIDVRPQSVDLGDGGCEFRIQLGDVNDFAVVLRFDVGADGEVVVLLGDRGVIHRDGKVGDVLLGVEELHDALDVIIGERVVVGLLFEKAAGIDELGAGVGFVLREHEDVHRDGGAE